MRRERSRRTAEDGGESGIRTHEAVLAPTRFPIVLLQPLGHLSASSWGPGAPDSPVVERAYRATSLGGKHRHLCTTWGKVHEQSVVSGLTDPTWEAPGARAHGVQ